MKFAICNETYGDWPLEKICADVAEAGYVGLEIAPFTLNNYGVTQWDEKQAKRIGDIVRSFGLDPLGLHWLLAKTEGYHLTQPDDAINDRTADYLIELAQFCAAMGGKVMVFGSPQQRDITEGQTYEDAFDRAVHISRKVCEIAGPLGVTLAMEPLGEVETNFLTTAAETIKLIEAVDHPACTLHLDVKAMSYETKPFAQIIEESKKHISHFHANDPNLRGPGMGEVEFEPIANALGKIGYDGYVSVEVFKYDPDAPTIARQSIEYMKKIWASVDG